VFSYGFSLSLNSFNERQSPAKNNPFTPTAIFLKQLAVIWLTARLHSNNDGSTF
jgi:hypothetical protein